MGSGYGSHALAGFRLTVFIIFTLALMPVQLVYTLARPRDPYGLPRLYHRLLLKLIGFQVRSHGVMALTPPVLFVANHSSYLDIPVLGALIPGSFVAKAEVRRWPLFGWMAHLQRTVFIERRSHRILDHRTRISQRLADGQNLILFPEGTSSDGLRVLPFKSGLFSMATHHGSLTVQPVSIACTAIDGLPVTRDFRPYYAWYGDMTLLGHLWNIFKCGTVTVDVVFHAPFTMAADSDRKALACACQRQVARGIEQCLSGRREPEPAPHARLPSR